MNNKRKFSVIILLFVLFGLAYSEGNFVAKKIIINVNKDKAIADGEDSIKLSYKIIDDNGVPLRNIAKEDIEISIDGEELNEDQKDNLVFKSIEPKTMNISIEYNDVKQNQKIEFEKDVRELKLSLSKRKIVANGKDSIVIKALDQENKLWKNPTEIYIDNKKIDSNVFSTKTVGSYVISLKSGKFKSKSIRVHAYKVIENLDLTADKTNIFSNNVDKITFNLKSTDQNQSIKDVDNFVIVDQKNRIISRDKSFAIKSQGTYKVRARYKNNYSNYITFEAKNPIDFKVMSHYPQTSTVNDNTTIDIILNTAVKSYENSVEVYLVDKKLDNPKVEGTITYDSPTKTLKFKSKNLLTYDKTYKVVLNKNILGKDENKLKENYTFEFKAIKRKESEMIKVERGNFVLGDETKKLWKFSSPTQEATITYDYLIGKTEVTFAEYDQYSRDMRLPLVKDQFGRENQPVINVSWFDAMNYANWLSKQENLPVAYDKDGDLIDKDGNKTRDITKVLGYRLPTEIEWEFAGRGGAKTNHTLYSGSNDIDKVAWYSETAKKTTHNIGTKAPNELGIYDMSGNVWEWINDNSGVYSSIERINSVGPRAKGMKILRGGSFNSIMSDTQLAFREQLTPVIKDIYYGFRLARTIQGEK